MQVTEEPNVRVLAAPPRIAALPPNAARPRWSVMIPTYNCTPFLKDALWSVLAQGIGPAEMQIEVVDDASTDADVAAIVAELGAGRVQYYRQPANVGSLRNFETCLNRAQGHLVHLLHGDDRVLPGFYAEVGRLFEQHPEAGSVFSHYGSIDEAGRRTQKFDPLEPEPGILQNWLLRIAEAQCLQYACVVVRREVYEHLGGFYGTDCGEDWEMWVRIARYYPVAYSPELLAEYRGRAGSISEAKERLGHALPETGRAIKLIERHLPKEHRKKVGDEARRWTALLGMGGAYRILHNTRDWSLVHQRIRQALELSQHRSIYLEMLKFYVKVLLRR